MYAFRVVDTKSKDVLYNSLPALNSFIASKDNKHDYGMEGYIKIPSGFLKTQEYSISKKKRTLKNLQLTCRLHISIGENGIELEYNKLNIHQNFNYSLSSLSGTPDPKFHKSNYSDFFLPIYTYNNSAKQSIYKTNFENTSEIIEIITGLFIKKAFHRSSYVLPFRANLVVDNKEDFWMFIRENLDALKEISEMEYVIPIGNKINTGFKYHLERLALFDQSFVSRQLYDIFDSN